MKSVILLFILCQSERVTMSCTICVHSHTAGAPHTHTHTTHIRHTHPDMVRVKKRPGYDATLRVRSTQKYFLRCFCSVGCYCSTSPIYLDLFSSFRPDCDDDYDDCRQNLARAS